MSRIDCGQFCHSPIEHSISQLIIIVLDTRIMHDAKVVYTNKTQRHNMCTWKYNKINSPILFPIMSLPASIHNAHDKNSRQQKDQN